MGDGFPEEGLFDHLMATRWYPETVDLYFEGDYRGVYDDVMAGLLGRGLVGREPVGRQFGRAGQPGGEATPGGPRLVALVRP